MNKVLCFAFALALAFPLGAIAQDFGASALDSLTKPQNYEARRASSSNADLTRNGDARGIPAGETLVLMEEQGPGVISHIWCTVSSPDPFHGRSLVLRIYYDGLDEPSVQAPLGDFFGVGHGALKDFTSAPVAVSSHGRSRVCYWRMPFRESIKVTVTNDSPVHKTESFYYYVDWQKHAAMAEDTPYFHAKYRQEFPAKPGNYTLLETEGRGHYVGTVHSAHQVETGWFGEGDDFFYIDGAEMPQLRGTGTEDYFNDAWGFREFATPFHGVTLYEGVLTGDRVTAYRWHVMDPIPFKKSLRVEIEHRGSVFNDQGTLSNFEMGSFLERPDWLSSVAFWYQPPPARIAEELPTADKRIAPYRFIAPKELTYRADPPLLVVPQDDMLAYIPNKPEASIEFDFDIEEPGRYRIDAVLVFSIMSGIYRAYLDGEALGEPIDFVIANLDPMWVPLDMHQLEAGTHTLRFEGVKGHSPADRKLAPKFYTLGMAGIALLRMEDMEGYRQIVDAELENR